VFRSIGLFLVVALIIPASAIGRPARTLPVGSPPLSDRAAAARVDRSAWEPRPGNRAENRRIPTRRELRFFRRHSDMTYKRRVSGRFRGTTDEIIQWAAHKHGIAEDVVRAVAVKESWWRMSTVGDDGDSFGLMQVRRPYHCCPFLARGSTAFNVDYWGAIIRSYFDGRETWLDTVERGEDYRAGDLWGSVGAWFSGRWRTGPSLDYVRDVRRIRRERTWRRRLFAENQTQRSRRTRRASATVRSTISAAGSSRARGAP
jgi:hypothetical protein